MAKRARKVSFGPFSGSLDDRHRMFLSRFAAMEAKGKAARRLMFFSVNGDAEGAVKQVAWMARDGQISEDDAETVIGEAVACGVIREGSGDIFRDEMRK